MDPADRKERLQRIIARAGVASRRAAEELITAGRVRVNGKIVTELGAKADPRADDVEVDGKKLIAEQPTYIVLHKPRGVVSTLADPEGRPTVAELLAKVPVRVYPVGRLDFATSGVLLCTNDGEFAQGLMHPRKDVPKTYVLKLDGVLDDADVERWRTGIRLEDGVTLPAEARILRHEDDKTWMEVTLREGRNQQIRRMGDATGHRVMRLARLSVAGVTSENLRPGEWRALTRDELEHMRETYGVPKRVRAAVAGSEAAYHAQKAHGRRSQHADRYEARPARPARPNTRPARGDSRDARDARPQRRPRRDFEATPEANTSSNTNTNTNNDAPRFEPRAGGDGPPRGRGPRPEGGRSFEPRAGGNGPPRGRGPRPEGGRSFEPRAGGDGPPRGRGPRPEGGRAFEPRGDGPPRGRGARPEGGRSFEPRAGGDGPPRGRGARPDARSDDARPPRRGPGRDAPTGGPGAPRGPRAPRDTRDAAPRGPRPPRDDARAPAADPPARKPRQRVVEVENDKPARRPKRK